MAASEWRPAIRGRTDPVWATCTSLAKCEVLGLRLCDVRVADRAVFVADGKGGHQRLTPIANTFFTALGDYLRDERPTGVDTEGPVWSGAPAISFATPV